MEVNLGERGMNPAHIWVFWSSNKLTGFYPHYLHTCFVVNHSAPLDPQISRAFGSKYGHLPLKSMKYSLIFLSQNIKTGLI